MGRIFLLNIGSSVFASFTCLIIFLLSIFVFFGGGEVFIVVFYVTIYFTQLYYLSSVYNLYLDFLSAVINAAISFAIIYSFWDLNLDVFLKLSFASILPGIIKSIEDAIYHYIFSFKSKTSLIDNWIYQ